MDQLPNMDQIFSPEYLRVKDSFTLTWGAGGRLGRAALPLDLGAEAGEDAGPAAALASAPV
jgi:hypothetical protein